MSTDKTITDDKERPGASERGKVEAEKRRRRQAEALRANLLRRKSQDRARAEPGEPDSDPDA